MSAARDVPDFMAESELIPRDLPPLLARRLAGFAIALVVAASLFAWLVPFPETVSCPFVLVPESGTDALKAPRRGRVERVAASDGGTVRAGELLFVLRSEEFRILNSDRATLAREVEAGKERLVELAAEDEARRRLAAAKVAEARARVAGLEREDASQRALDVSLAERHRLSLAQARARAARLESVAEITSARATVGAELHAKVLDASHHGAVSELEGLRDSLSALDSQHGHEQTVTAFLEARALAAALESARANEVCERAVLAAAREGRVAESRAEVVRLEREAEVEAVVLPARTAEVRRAVETAALRKTSLDRELEGVDGDLLRVLAPQAGVVVRLGPRQGAVIERGEVLCELASAGAKLHAELSVAERDAGRLAAGRPVRLLLSAFPFTRYGVVHARLAWISPKGSDSRFRAIATLDESSLVVDGAPVALRAGMGGEARSMNGRRTLVEYALEPLETLRERFRAEGQTQDVPPAAGSSLPAPAQPR